ncbi:MAG: hypothetical protein J5I62_01130 [Flavobacteriales bacterium]|nr:hypothetical protein [Flavobacteriales bacterium]MEB2342301.1 S-4TM family putative pore-forming effector [Flavobacteriia bacterium]
MSTILTRQNEPRQLDRLAAQRALYSRAKDWFILNVIVFGAVPVALTAIGIWDQVYRPLSPVVGLIMVFIDTLLVTPHIRRLKESAARIQEAFDCDVLALPWSDIKVGKPEAIEVEKEWSDRYRPNAHKHSPLVDWYTPAIHGLSLQMARVVCQRENIHWDGQLRRYLCRWLLGAILVITLSFLVIGVVKGMLLIDLLKYVVVPLAPALIVSIRHWHEQIESAKRLDKLRDHLDSMWRDGLARASPEAMASKSRALQDEIFDHRKRSVPLFDWLFEKFRDKFEERAYHTAELMAKEAKAALSL